MAHASVRRVSGTRELEGGGWRKASDKTHLAGKLHATHPGEAHDGGSREVESKGVEETFGGFRMLQVNDGSRDPDKLVSTCADWSGNGPRLFTKEQRDRDVCSGFSRAQDFMSAPGGLAVRSVPVRVRALSI